MGVSQSSAQSEIKKRYYALSKKYHPDKSGDHKSMSVINEAYGVLSNPEKRRLYDFDLRSLQDKLKQSNVQHSKASTTKESTNMSPAKHAYKKQSQNASVKKSKFWRNFAFVAAGLILVFGAISYLSYLSAQRNEPKPVKEPTINQDIVQTTQQQQAEIINFKTINKENPDLLVGNTNVIQEGEDGERVTTYRLVYKNGQLQSKNQLSVLITKMPQDKIIEIGTKKPETTKKPDDKKPTSSTPSAICKDGSYSYDDIISVKTCEDHGGVGSLIN